MTGAAFVDSNILIYAHDADAGFRQERAAALLRDLWETRRGRLSTQVLQEFYVNVTQKIKVRLDRAAAREVIRNYVSWAEIPTTPETVLRACEIGETWRVSFWDAMIVAGAEQNQVSRLYTEDLAHGSIIAGICIVNPFLPAEPAAGA